MNINFLGNIKNIAPIENKTQIHHTSCTKPDCFEKSKMQISIDYAKCACIKTLEGKNPTEHSVAIDKDGNILYENDGEKMHCGIEFEKLEPDTTIIHGHPGEELMPLSPGDIKAFLKTPEIKTMAAVCKNGASCKMTKPETFCFQDINPGDIDEIFIKNWLDCTGKSYKADEDYYGFYRDKLKEKTGENPPYDTEQMLFQCRINGISVLPPHVKAYFDLQSEAKTDKADEIEILKEFNRKIADIYGLELNL